MSMENRLELRLTQKLILTPQLQQAIKLLQMQHMELSQYLNQELVENPLLEEIHDEISLDEMIKEEKESLEIEDTFEDTEKPLEGFVKFTVDEYFEERASDGRDLGYFTPGTVTPPSFEQFLSGKSDLYDHLLWQLRLSNEGEEEVKKIAELIIGNLDENGYLTVTIEEIKDLANAEMEKVEKALSLIQSFDPPGVGARNVQECLLLQISNLGLNNTIVENIIKNDLALLEKKKYLQIAQKYNLQIEDVMHAVKIIEGLEPKPGRNYSKENVNYIVPDVYIFKTGDSYQIILNDEGIPKLRVNNYYKELLQNEKCLKEDKQYLLEKFRSAIGLLKSLDHRYKTIYRVTEALIELQKEFFENGVEYLKPLTLKDVAVLLNLHESTISRVTSNKFFSCEHGIFPFKYLFCSGLGSGQETIASNSVKNMIRKLISEENPLRPLSDKRISDILKRDGIIIARRTVAKYREEMGIPARFMRKRITK